MILVFASIPLMVLALAIATVPILLAMRREADTAALRRPVSTVHLPQVRTEELRRAA